MSLFSITRIRIATGAGLMLAVLSMAGCGSQTGPSGDKARLDLQDRMTQAYNGILKVGDFGIVERQVLRFYVSVQGASGLRG